MKGQRFCLGRSQIHIDEMITISGMICFEREEECRGEDETINLTGYFSNIDMLILKFT